MRKHRAPQEQKAIYETYKQSGLSVREFCKLNGISNKSLWRWGKEFKQDGGSKIAARVTKIKNPPENIKFYPIEKSRNSNFSNTLSEVVLPNGINIKIEISKDDIRNFLQELIKWR